MWRELSDPEKQLWNSHAAQEKLKNQKNPPQVVPKLVIKRVANVAHEKKRVRKSPPPKKVVQNRGIDPLGLINKI